MLSIIKGKGFKVLYLVLMGFIVLTGITLSDLSCSSGGGGSGSLTQMLYVLNSDGSVSVINPSAGTTVTTLSVGGSAHIVSSAYPTLRNLNPLQTSTPSISAFQGVYGIAANPNTHKVYIVTGSNTVSVINTTTNKVVTTINVPAGAFGIAVNPATNLAYVGNSSPSQGIVTVIDLSTNSVVTTINTQSALPPADVIVNPVQGGDVYVSGWASGIIDDINTTSNQVAYSWAGTASKYPIGLALDPTHNLLYTSTYLGNLEISDVSPSALKSGNYIKAVYPIAPNDTCPGIAINTQANVVYMTDNPGGKLYAVNASNGSILSTINIGGNPQAVSYDPSTNNIYVVCDGNCSGLTTVNASTNTVSNTINTPPGTTPVGIITTPGSPSVGNQNNSAKPSLPTNVTATAGNGQVTLNWSASSGATSYDVYQSTTPNSLKKVGSSTSTNYTAIGLTNGTLYYFIVIAVNSNGQSGPSNEVSATPSSSLPAPPPAPTGLTSTAGNKQVTLSWAASTGATSYNIYDSTVSGGPYTNVASTSNTSTTITGLQSINGPTYYFVVTAVNSAGESGYSNEANSVAYVANTYAVGSEPYGIAIDSSGNVWVANLASNNVTELNSSGTTIGTYAVGSAPVGIAIDSSGNVWVANNGSNNVTELNSSGSVIGTYAVGSQPDLIAIDASGNIWISMAGNNDVTKLNPSGSVIGTYTIGSTINPGGIAIDASGNVWVLGWSSNNVTELNSSGSVIGTYAVGSYPVGIAIDSSGNILVTNSGSGSYNITKLNSSGSVIGTYPVGNIIFGIAIDASGNLWVANDGSNNVTELNSSGSVIGTYAVGSHPNSVAIDASGNVWVVNNVDNTVTKIVGVAKGPQYWPYTGPVFPGGGNIG